MVDYISVMAADGKLYQRTGQNSAFIGCLGVCLGFSDPSAFKSRYPEIIKQHFGQVIDKTGRKIIKSHDVHQENWRKRDLFLESLGGFVQDICASDVMINVVFTTFNPQKLPERIKIYGTNKAPEEQIDVIKFLNLLSNYYPYITTWKVSKTAQLRNSEVYLDNFSYGVISHAWNELCTHHSVKVYPHGDSCNPFISSADIITRYIDEYLFNYRLHLEEESILRAFDFCKGENVHVFYVGHPEIREIVPLHKELIDFRDHYPHPMIYLVKEGLFDRNETNFIESSPAWTRLLNYASVINGSVKLLDLQKDPRYIKPGDMIVYFDSEGEKKAQYIAKMGYDVTITPIGDIPR